MIKEIRVENQLEPINIIEENPRFSWVLSDVKRQISYQVIVSSSLNNEGDLYNSGEVISNKNFDIYYRGSPLKSLQVCYLKVIVKTDKGIDVAYSKFEIALKEEKDFKAQWIFLPVNHSGGTQYFRKQLEMPVGNIKRARVFLVGLGYSELYINGQKVNENCYLNPGQTSYNETVLYDCYDILKYLKEEKNVLGVEVGYGWYGARKIRAYLYIEYEDGTIYEDGTRAGYGWWVAKTPTIYNSVYGGEVYDARLESAWATSECTPDWDNGWMFPIYAPAEKGKLIPQKIPPIKICQEYQAIQVFDNVYDFAHNISGWVQISVRGNKGDRVIIKYAERLDNNKINQLNLRSAESKDEYILKGEGLEIWHPRFTYHGFQYVEVTLIGEVILQSIIAQHLHTDNKLIGYFETDDEIINKLHEISVITEQNNEHSILTDCPQRDERFGWLNDVSTRVFQAVNNFDMDLLFYKVVRDIKDAQNAEGMISDTCPYYTGGQPADVTSLSFLLLANEAYIHYGDKKIVEDFYLYHKKWVDYLLTRQKDYIMDYYYYADWVPADKLPNALSDGIYISTAFLFWHLKTLAKLAKYINKRNDNKRYLEIAEKVRVALNKKYYNVETGLYSRGTHAELSFALNLDIVEAKERAKVLDNLIKSINEVGNHLTCGNQGYRHVFEVLCKEGYTDLFLDILKNPEYPGWGFMLKCGATTVWERWEEEMSNLMDSFDHPMFGAYDQMFYKYLAGINFEGFGCDNIIIRPISCRLNYIKASIHTIHGLLSSESKRVGKYINYTITVPSNKIVTFIPPFKIKEINGIKRNVKEVRLESGVYTIKIKEK